MTNQKTTNQKKEKSDDQPDANQSEGRKVMTNQMITNQKEEK